MTAPAYGYLHSATVHSLDEVTGAVYLRGVPLAPTSRWGPVATCVFGLQPGDRVVAASMGTSRDALMVIGKVGDRLPDIGDIPGLVEALAGKADDSEITAINGTLTTHAAAIGANTTTLGTHATTLAGHTTTLGSYGTRIAAEEARLGHVDPVTGTAGRPTTGLYDGRPIYRKDKGFMEFYESSTSKWRVRGCVTVDALADITDPVVDQVAILRTDKMIYRCVNGTTWVAVLHTSTADRGHARYRMASGHPNVGSGAVEKLALATAEMTTADITRSVDHKEFTVVRGGLWALGCRTGWAGNVNGTSRWSWIGPSNNNADRYVTASVPPSGFVMVPTASDMLYVNAGTVLSLWGYQDSGVALGFDLGQAQTVFWAKWMCA